MNIISGMLKVLFTNIPFISRKTQSEPSAPSPGDRSEIPRLLERERGSGKVYGFRKIAYQGKVYKVGEKVRVQRSNGSMESDWTLTSIYARKDGSDCTVTLVNANRDSKQPELADFLLWQKD